MLQHAEASETSPVSPCQPLKLRHIQPDTYLFKALEEQVGARYQRSPLKSKSRQGTERLLHLEACLWSDLIL